MGRQDHDDLGPELRRDQHPSCELYFDGTRNTGNTLAANAGASLRELMERMGHDSERAALIYLHSSDERQHQIADTLSQLAIEELTRGSKRQGGQSARRSDATGTKQETGLLKIIRNCQQTGADLRRKVSAPSATRTRDLLLRRQLLYPLSYRGIPRRVLSDAVQRRRRLA